MSLSDLFFISKLPRVRYLERIQFFRSTFRCRLGDKEEFLTEVTVQTKD
jgi:hypothetical protein